MLLRLRKGRAFPASHPIQACRYGFTGLYGVSSTSSAFLISALPSAHSPPTTATGITESSLQGERSSAPTSLGCVIATAPSPKALAFLCTDTELVSPQSTCLCSKSCCSDTTLMPAGSPGPRWYLSQQQHVFPLCSAPPLLQILRSRCTYRATALCNPKPWHKQQIFMTLLPARDRFPEGGCGDVTLSMTLGSAALPAHGTAQQLLQVLHGPWSSSNPP